MKYTSPDVIKLFLSCSTQLSMKFIRLNKKAEGFKANKSLSFSILVFHEQLKFHAQLS